MILFSSDTEFQSTPSARRATDNQLRAILASDISIHALREESDVQAVDVAVQLVEFQSTPSARRATFFRAGHHVEIIYFNPRPPRGERPCPQSTRPIPALFQSTPSARRATAAFLFRTRRVSYFNPRPPRGERPSFSVFRKNLTDFNPRPPRGERQPLLYHGAGEHNFNPRPPRGERPLPAVPTVWQVTYFNPRPPRGERRLDRFRRCRAVKFQSTPSARRATCTRGIMLDAPSIFQSTPSARRATCCHRRRTGRRCISIHALREESDGIKPGQPPHQQDFNPRPPRGERPQSGRLHLPNDTISIHALREESDRCPCISPSPTHGFQSTPSARRATGLGLCLNPGIKISIHALREESDDRHCP